MGKFNEYSQKATPADNDTLMIYDATSKANKLSPFSGIWNWIVGKLTNAVINNLQTSNKTVLGAINELNSNLLKTQIIDTRSTNKPPQYYYSNYPQTVVYELKESISVDDPFQAAAFLVLQTITPWNDTSGGSVIQRAYMSGKVKIRYSKSIDSWSEWTELNSKSLYTYTLPVDSYVDIKLPYANGCYILTVSHTFAGNNIYIIQGLFRSESIGIYPIKKDYEKFIVTAKGTGAFSISQKDTGGNSEVGLLRIC